jgi:spore coat protein U-like protein
MKNNLSALMAFCAAGLLSLLGMGNAQAAITCGPLSTQILNFAYVTGTNSFNTNNILPATVSVTCSRTAAGDATTLTLGADNGTFPSGGNANNARLTFLGVNNDIRYDLYRNNLCGTPSATNFRDTNGTRISSTFPTTTLNTPFTLTFDYWACIPSQAVASFPAGVYLDTVILTLRAGNANPPLVTGTIQVNINAPAKCGISNGPNLMVFSYTAFGPASFQFTQFNANCTNFLPYTMVLSPSNGVVAGLRYQLGLSDAVGSATAIGPASLSRTGGPTGTRIHTINGVMDAGQAGTAGAPVPQPHTLTITY